MKALKNNHRLVNPSAQVDDPNDQVLCNGDSILVEFTTQNTIGNTTYTL